MSNESKKKYCTRERWAADKNYMESFKDICMSTCIVATENFMKYNRSFIAR
jgi:hypothetical protein